MIQKKYRIKNYIKILIDKKNKEIIERRNTYIQYLEEEIHNLKIKIELLEKDKK